MKAWQYDHTSSPPHLLFTEVPTPTPAGGEVLIQVHAAGVTPTELGWYPTTHQQDGSPRHLPIPGHEFSGVIVAATPDTGFQPGDEVFGMNDWFAPGATAEFCTAPASAITLKHKELSHAEAASIPIGALTAWQGLFDHAHLKSGERVLIHGGSGAVGVFAIQFARQQGAHILTTASARNRDLLLKLGAHQIIDYHTERFEDLAQNVDVIFDTVGGETRECSWPLLAPQGRLITVAADVEQEADERTQQAFFIVIPDRNQLDKIAQQLASGQLEAVVNQNLPFDHAPDAYFPTHNRPRSCGKTVLVLP